MASSGRSPPCKSMYYVTAASGAGRRGLRNSSSRISLRCARSATGTVDGLLSWRKLERVACKVFLFLSLPARGIVAQGGGGSGVGSKGAGSSLNILLQKSAVCPPASRLSLHCSSVVGSRSLAVFVHLLTESTATSTVFSVHCAVVRGYASSRAIAVDRGMNNPASHYLISGSHASANPSSSHRPIKWEPLFTRYTDSESVREKSPLVQA
jgi:hypothetical protein